MVKSLRLVELNGMQCFQQMNVDVKVIRVNDVVEVKSGKKKQDIVVGDSSGSIQATMWEKEIGTMEAKVWSSVGCTVVLLRGLLQLTFLYEERG